ncbi:cyclin-like protein [Ophiostoma piceae UAMH 11346]|uniref:Cyclin-like protein n=1 Tax=Ophiostoma piceae (strain UAMH 11346) TaxID=1262450 RepID=S3C8C7_OPHP1|nr:cyclin-like protein [Ophiostoma piceae UAMH 11346]
MPGGVCAVLDYDVEMMAEYVAEMANRLAMGTPKTPESFRKFISQILSSTRLPRTTILLGMNYFAKRINMMNMMNGNKVTLSEGHIWRLLTVALLLGSKFLDDNTFQNRSWADVSGIPVRELNKLEREWMESISWRMYVNLDLSEDYQAWINSWSDWEAGKKQMQQQAQQARDRMASLSLPADAEYPNATRNPMAYAAWCKEQIAEYNRLTSRAKPTEVGMQAYRGHDQQQQQGWTSYATPNTWAPHGAPVTPPDSGYGTPEYNMNTATAMSSQFTSPDWYHQAQQPHLAPHHGHNGGAYATYNNKSYPSRNNYQNKLPTYFYGHGHNIWENRVDRGNGMNCYQNAGHGHAGQNFYGHGMNNAYGQPVVG